MTPGPVDFTVDGTDQRTWDDVTTAAITALGAAFEIAVDPDAARAGERRATWLDTFDWRLHKAGLTLEYIPGRRASELRLSGLAGGDDPLSQSVTGWQADRPHQAADLGAGFVGARIARLIAPRALVPVAATSTAITVYRLLNTDGKTVARLAVSRSRLTGPGEAVPLAPRLAVSAVRGYQAQARRAARLLAAVPGLKTEAGPPLGAALGALGRRPGDYSNKVDADITAAMPGAQAAATILLRLLDTIDANLPGVLADTDTEFLHDLRVSVRRTRSGLKLFGDALSGPRAPALSPEELAFFAAEFKWVGDLTTPTRDLDVHLLDFTDTARGLAAAKPDDLEPFRAYLRQRRHQEFRALTRGLRSARYTGLTTRWRQRLTEIRDGGGVSTARSGASGTAAGATAGLLAAERTRVAFTKVARRGAAITADSPAEALHDLRKRCKELRYALEFFAPVWDPAASAPVVGDLKRLQDCLGEFQDTEIQITEIRTLAGAMLAAHEAPAVTLLAMGEITAGLAARQRAARADFERRFAAFAGAGGQRRVSALLRGRGPR